MDEIFAMTTDTSPKGQVRLRWHGELDIANEPMAADALHDVLASTALRTLVVDLSDLRFLDCAGVRCLIGGRGEAAAAGVAFEVCGARGRVQRVLRLLGLDEIMLSSRYNSGGSH